MTISAKHHETQALFHEAEAAKINSSTNTQDFAIQAHLAASEAHEAANDARRAVTHSNKPAGSKADIAASLVSMFATTSSLAAADATLAANDDDETKAALALGRAVLASENAMHTANDAVAHADKGV